MTKNFKQNKIFLFVMSLLCLFVIVLISYLSRHCTYFGDDLSYSINHSHFFSSINPLDLRSAFKWHGGGCIALFFTNMFNYNIPHLFGLHPLDFMGSPHGIIKGFFTCLMLFSVTSFSTFFKKSKLLYALIFISIFLYLIDSSLNLGALTLH